jgi:hypothetical protein
MNIRPPFRPKARPDHARAVDRGSELSAWVELGERGMEGCVVFPEFDRKIDDG